MNLGVLSVRNNRVVFLAMLLAVIGGLVAYRQLGRLEDPEFTIKQTVIITSYPGASAEEVAKEVTNPIETAVQQLGQLDHVESESSRGRSLVHVIIKSRYDKYRIQQVWDELRRKVNDVQSQLPPSARGQSFVFDNYGDVFGIFFAITGDGYSFPELRRYAEFLQRELLLVPGVRSIALFAEQQEVVFLEISRLRLAQLGISEEQIYGQLQARNIAADGGRVRVGDQHIAIDPKGTFGSAEDMLELVIGSDRTGRQLFLKDVATIERHSQDPPRRLLRYDGKPAIGLGISTVLGGNVVTMGEGVRRKLEQLESYRPVGVEFGEINFQPTAVTSALNAFMFNLLKAVTIVIIVLIFAMGFRTGLIIGMVLFLTIMATFLGIYLKGDILMERISLGALIIALCMLTDNAIIVIETCKVGIERGEDKLDVVRNAVAQNQGPLLGATAIGIFAFAAIGLSEDASGEMFHSLFWVILISLGLSWVASITITPLLSYLMFKPATSAAGEASVRGDPYDSLPFRIYRKLLAMALRFRWAMVLFCIATFIAALFGLTRVKQGFFPNPDRPQFIVDVFLPAGTHIRETEAFADEAQQYLQNLPDVTHVTSLIGGGGPRFLLVYNSERENSAYVQFLIDVDDWRRIDGLITTVQNHIDERYPNATATAKKFLFGPSRGGRVQARFQGPDSAVLRALGDQARRVLQDAGGTVGVRGDWLQPMMVIRPDLLEFQARRNGISRVDVAQTIQSSFEGRVVGFYREPSSAATGIYPQETRFLPIIARPPLTERQDVGAINSLQIWSPVAGRMIPMNQVVSGTEISWEAPIIMRRDRSPTLTVHADPRTGLPSELFGRVRSAIEQIKLPPGYSLEWGGEFEDSADARAALAKPLPFFLAFMVFICVCLFNSIRATLLMWLIMPLVIIGVTAGLLLARMPFTFVALLGLLSLGGELIKMQIVVLSKIRGEIGQGSPSYQAILNGSTSKVRPVCMVVITTVLGMIPLLLDPFFGAMAACLMFGLSFAAVLTLIVTPVLYAIFFNIHEPSSSSPNIR
ncbi:MAG: efflux RND transporter permease subunit [Phycisphaerae bacterium]|nr:efflux RND transporter permease subunit [Phycisphaerae bacterium]